jgi:Ca2+-binding RTX toxin-like protein
MGTTTDTNPTPLDMTGWNTVFFDGFNGTQLDWQKWPITYGGSMYWNGAFYWDGSQVNVGNGELTIGMDKQANGLWSVGGLTSAPYAGAPADAGNGFLYGRVEIRAKTSIEVTGAGPCFLLWPTSNDHWPPEVDILETPASGNGMFTNHWQGPAGNNDDWYASYEFPLDHSQWHTYTLDWFPDRMTLYVDGKAIYTTTQNIPHEKMSVGLQGHVGTATDGWYGSPNASGVNSVDISVDWVRVSQFSGTVTPPPVTPTPVVTNLTLTGTAGDDALAGGAGADTITGGSGNDDLQGGAGNDRLAGGTGDDGLTLGAGADVVVFTKGDGVDWVVDFTPGTDRLELHGFDPAQVTTKAASYWGMAGLDVLLPNGEKLFLQGVTALGANDLVLKDVPVAAPSGLVLSGTAGNDTLKGGALADSLSGGAGDDSLLGGDGQDTLLGGAGNDILYGNGGADVLLGGDGDDRLRGFAGNDVITGGAGADRLYLARAEGQDRVTDFTLGQDKVVLSGVTTAEITGGAAVVGGVSGFRLSLSDGTSMFLEGLSAVTAKQLGLSGSFAAGGTALPATTATVLGTAGDDWLKGGTGADYLQGGAGSDDLQGLAGNDVLRGGLGDDGLTGGVGADLFVFAKGDGHDWVVDFARGTDRLRLEGYVAGDLTQAVETRWGMAGLAIDLGTGGDEVFLQGVTAVLANTDLVFA